ncbi:MAG: hypothetical protein JW889_10240, partial [Verrucomicrobia bacterium]|nr:hypothetical protein [Verrucomicrobiota bacterium]
MDDALWFTGRLAWLVWARRERPGATGLLDYVLGAEVAAKRGARSDRRIKNSACPSATEACYVGQSAPAMLNEMETQALEMLLDGVDDRLAVLRMQQARARSLRERGAGGDDATRRRRPCALATIEEARPRQLTRGRAVSTSLRSCKLPGLLGWRTLRARRRPKPLNTLKRRP